MSLGLECTCTLYSFICHYCVPFLLTDDNMLTHDNLFTQDNLLTQDKFQCCHLPLPLIKDYLDILYIIILLFIQFSSNICVLYLNVF